MKYFLGGKKPTPDARDRKLSAPAGIVLPETGSVSFRPAITEQGTRSSCTGHAIAAFMEQILASRGEPVGPLSPAYPWYFGRASEGAADRDDGVTSRGIMAAVHQHGICPADYWPLDRSVRLAPDEIAVAYGQALRLPEYLGLDRLSDIQYAIAVEGYSVMLGVTVFDDWMSGNSERTGIIQYDPMRPVVGYHEVVALEYDNRKQRFLCQNSWGTDYGDGGYISLPYEFVTREATDAWSAGYDSLPDQQPRINLQDAAAVR